MKRYLINKKIQLSQYLKNKEWFIFIRDWFGCNKEYFRRYRQNRIFNNILQESKEVSETITKLPAPTGINKNNLPISRYTKNIKIENNLIEFEGENSITTIYLPLNEKKTKPKSSKKVKNKRPIKWTKRNLEKEWNKELSTGSNTIEPE